MKKLVNTVKYLAVCLYLMAAIQILGLIFLPSFRDEGSIAMILVSYGCQLSDYQIALLILSVMFAFGGIIANNVEKGIGTNVGIREYLFSIKNNKQPSRIASILYAFFYVSFPLYVIVRISYMWNHCGANI